MPMEEFLLTNALQIPNLFASAFDGTSRLGFVLFSIMLVAAILHENLAALKGESDYKGLFLRALVILGLFILYGRFFIWMVYATDLLSKVILPEEEFKEVIRAVFHQIFENKDFGVLKFLSVITVLNFTTYAVALALLGVLTWLRFVFLALLYVVGPLLVGIGVYKQTSQGLGFWVRSLVAVSSWTVVLSILLKVIATMNVTSVYLPRETNSASAFAANLLFILLFISVPLISHQMTARSGSLSGLGSAVIGLGTAFITRTVVSPFFRGGPTRSRIHGEGAQGPSRYK